MKKVILVGPSLQALEGFDLSECKNYDIVVGTNKVMESELSRKVDFDVIFLNTSCVKFYSSPERAKSLTGKTIFVKEKKDITLLSGVLEERAKIYDIESTWNKLRQKFAPHVPYYGTTIVDYLSSICAEVFVAGFDFYYNGFSSKMNYISGYYDLEDLREEERCHSIEKDLLYYKSFLLNNKNIILENKTQKYFEMMLREKEII